MVVIENLPEVPHAKILEELLKNYPGVEKVTSSDKTSAQVVFNSADNAKFAVIGLHRFKVDQSGR